MSNQRPFEAQTTDSVRLANIQWNIREELTRIERMIEQQNYGYAKDELRKFRQSYGLLAEDIGYRG